MRLFTKNPRYAVVYNGWIFYSYIFDVVIIEYNKEITEYQVEVNENYHYTKLIINPELTIPANRNMIRIDNSQTVPPEGQYQLYRTFKLGSTEYITSRILYENMFCIYYITEDKVSYDQVKKITSKKHTPIKYHVGDDTYIFLLRAGYIQERDEETGKVTQKYSNRELTEFLRRTNLLYPLDEVKEHANYSFIMLNGGVNKSNTYNSSDTTAYGNQMEDVYLDGLNYANQVINTLQSAYPEVNFFPSPKDWDKEKSSYQDIKDANGKDYKEWCRYKIGYEDYTQARRDFFNYFGPVALHTRLRIEFEYAALDTATFRRRRTDLFLDQFISYYARDDVKLDADLLGDNTKQVGFTIHWIKDEAMEGETVTQKGTSMLDTVELDLHTMRFQCELRINVLRFCKKLPPILQTIFDIKADDEEKSAYYKEHKANEEEQRIILDVYEKGGTLRDGDIYNLKDAQKREAVKQNLKGQIVEFTPGHKELQYNEGEMRADGTIQGAMKDIGS